MNAQYKESLLDVLYMEMFSTNKVDKSKIDYDNKNVGYNECGDFYYQISTYFNNEVESIFVIVNIKDVNKSDADANYDYFDKAYKEFYLSDHNNSFEDTIDYVMSIEDSLVEYFDNMKNYQHTRKAK